MFRGPSEDEQSFGVIDELYSSSDEDMDDNDQYAGDDIHLTQTLARRPINVESIPTPKIASPIVKKREISESIQLQNKKARIKADQFKTVKTSAKKKKKSQQSRQWIIYEHFFAIPLCGQ